MGKSKLKENILIHKNSTILFGHLKKSATIIGEINK